MDTESLQDAFRSIPVEQAADDPAGSRPREASPVPQPPMAVLLREGFRWFMDRLNADATDLGEPRLSAPAAIVASHLRLEGSRPADIARAMGVSRQHVHAVVRELVDGGIVDVVPDPTSRRDRLIVPTVAGEARLQRVVARLAALEAELSQRLGPADLELLQDLLARLWGPRSARPSTLDPR